MKKSTIIIFLMLAMLNTQAQDYLISFEGSGDTTGVGTVKVDNLTSGASVTLNGGDILHLVPATGIATADIDFGTLQIYPNPMTEQSVFTFAATANGNADICIVDLSGKTICKISTLLSSGVHNFCISGINQGMYLVKVTGKAYNYSTKLVSQSSLNSKARIEYISSVNNTASNPLKSISSTIDMPYSIGDILLYKGITGTYSEVITDIPTSSKTITFAFVACTDSDGNHYATVQIGTGKKDFQIWMAENLNVGIRINGVEEQSDNGLIEKYCYADLETNCDVYGGLYQWNEMMHYLTTEGVQGICPAGWHLPTDAEWTTLTTYLGGEGTAGGKMKETGFTHWASPNTGATNSSGFTALPGSIRDYDGSFAGLGNYAHFYTSTESSSGDAWRRHLYFGTGNVFRANFSKLYGFSVRCLKD